MNRRTPIYAYRPIRALSDVVALAGVAIAVAGGWMLSRDLSSATAAEGIVRGTRLMLAGAGIGLAATLCEWWIGRVQRRRSRATIQAR